MRERIVYLIFVVVLALLSGLTYFVFREDQGAIQTPSSPSASIQKLIPDGSFAVTELKGFSLSEYSVLWWTWIYSIPKNKVNPVIDPDGKSCSFNQSGDVWFLAGSPGDNQRYIRDCIIPKGKHLFFPIITLISTTKAMCQDAILKAEIDSDYIKKIEVTLDDKILPDPLKFHAASPGCFRLKGYLDGYSGLGRYPVASDGYWILMNPLDAGEHVLSFRAEYYFKNKDKKEEEKPDFIQNVQYRLTVE